jgi:uncharacterized cupin superfamily protein
VVNVIDLLFRDGVLKLCDTQTVRNADEVDVREMIKGRHNMRLRQLGKPAGSVELGATLTEVAPGGISFPRHAHYVNEEAIYVLSGSGEARIGDARVPVRHGDWIALPTGPEHAHQMVNVSTAEPLVYRQDRQNAAPAPLPVRGRVSSVRQEVGCDGHRPKKKGAHRDNPSCLDHGFGPAPACWTGGHGTAPNCSHRCRHNNSRRS